MGTLSQEDYIRRVKEQMAEMQEHRQRLTEARERLMKTGLSSRSGGPHATAEETHELPELCISSPPDAPNVANNDSGWAALAKSVREIDENVVKDYKEDIDTILVFAGLYSAVLTGLLAISINGLQQDPNVVIIALLTQLTRQTYSFSLDSGILSSTAQPSDLQPPSFSPTLSAKRVNILWFASLMLSLSSASFGILVKQWLREYLADTQSSPEARMRVRYFREPGLRNWKVFVIAAALPLLLQLSLALFFTGLCFYTLEVHYSVGYVTIALACAWGVLFVAVSFAPVLSPRCPYKTPILKSITRFLRHSLFRILDRTLTGKAPKPSKLEEIWNKVLSLILCASRRRTRATSPDSILPIFDAQSLQEGKSSGKDTTSSPPSFVAEASSVDAGTRASWNILRPKGMLRTCSLRRTRRQTHSNPLLPVHHVPSLPAVDSPPSASVTPPATATSVPVLPSSSALPPFSLSPLALSVEPTIVVNSATSTGTQDVQFTTPQPTPSTSSEPTPATTPLSAPSTVAPPIPLAVSNPADPAPSTQSSALNVPALPQEETLHPPKLSPPSSSRLPPSPVAPTAPLVSPIDPTPADTSLPHGSEQESPDKQPQWQIPSTWTWRLLSYDEKVIASVASNDRRALLSLDATQQDDRLLHKICSVLEEKHTPLAGMLDFVLEVIACRLPPDNGLPARPILPSQIVDLTALRPRTCVILMDTLAKALDVVLKKVPFSTAIDWDVPEMQETLALLCGKLPCLPSDTVYKVLFRAASGHLENRVIPFMRALTRGVPPEQRFVLGLHLQERLEPMLLELDGDDFENHIIYLVKLYCNGCGTCIRRSYGNSFLAHREDMGPVLENHFMKIVLDYFQHQTKKANARWAGYHSNIMAFVNNAYSTSKEQPWQAAYVGCFPALLMHPTIGPEVASLFYHHAYWSSSSLFVFLESFLHSVDYRQAMLEALSNSVIAYIDECNISASKERIHPAFLIGIVRFLFVQLTVLSHILIGETTPGAIGWFGKYFQPLWQKMFRAISPALRRCLEFADVHAELAELSGVAVACLENMKHIEQAWKNHLEKAGMLTPGASSLFDRDLIEALCELAPEEEAEAYMLHRETVWKNDDSEHADDT